MTSILIPALTSRGPDAVYQPQPRVIGPAQGPYVLPNEQHANIWIEEIEEEILLSYAPTSAPGYEARNPGAEALLGNSHPVFGDAVVSSGDAEHMSQDAIGWILRTAGPEVEA